MNLSRIAILRPCPLECLDPTARASASQNTDPRTRTHREGRARTQKEKPELAEEQEEVLSTHSALGTRQHERASPLSAARPALHERASPPLCGPRGHGVRRGKLAAAFVSSGFGGASNTSKPPQAGTAAGADGGLSEAALKGTAGEGADGGGEAAAGAGAEGVG